MLRSIKRIFLLCIGFLLVIPISSVYAAPGSLSVGFSGDHDSMGAFVDLTANQSMNVTGFDLNLEDTEVTVTIYYKSSSTTMGDTTNPGAWTLYQSINVTGNGPGGPTNIAITPFLISSGQTYAFFILTDEDGKIYNLDDEAPDGISSASNAALTILSAYESHDGFEPGETYNGWGWQGTVYYDTLESTAIPTLSEWGMIVFSLLLAGTAMWFIRNRSNTGIAA